MLARLTVGSRQALCRVRNVSDTGFGIETSNKLQRGDSLTITFPDYQCEGHVSWSRDVFAGVQTNRAFCHEDVVSRYAASAERPKWEHQYLTMLSAELAQSVALSKPIPGIDHHRIRQRFSQVLRAHLKYEDWAIYPALIRHADPLVSAAAVRLKAEMGGLEQVHSDYTRHWIDNTTQDHWADYCRDTKALIEALMRRLRQEDLHLYAT